MSRLSQKHQRGPVEIIEAKGVKIPIYRSDAFGHESYVIAYYREGKRVRERIGSLAAAREHARNKIRELTSGVAHVASYTPKQAAVLAEAVEIAQRNNVSLIAALLEYEEAKGAWVPPLGPDDVRGFPDC